MKKYLGIVKKETETAIGVDIRILTKFSNSRAVLKRWMKLYPSSETILLNNNEALEKFFADFEDLAPITKEQKLWAKKLYHDFMNDND